MLFDTFEDGFDVFGTRGGEIVGVDFISAEGEGECVGFAGLEGVGELAGHVEILGVVLAAKGFDIEGEIGPPFGIGGVHATVDFHMECGDAEARDLKMLMRGGGFEFIVLVLELVEVSQGDIGAKLECDFVIKRGAVGENGVSEDGGLFVPDQFEFFDELVVVELVVPADGAVFFEFGEVVPAVGVDGGVVGVEDVIVEFKQACGGVECFADGGERIDAFDGWSE